MEARKREGQRERGEKKMVIREGKKKGHDRPLLQS